MRGLGSFGMEKANLDEVEDVDIDDNGRFKYVLIKLYHPNYEENYKYIVRGYKWAGFHGKRTRPVSRPPRPGSGITGHCHCPVTAIACRMMVGMPHCMNAPLPKCTKPSRNAPTAWTQCTTDFNIVKQNYLNIVKQNYLLVSWHINGCSLHK